MRNEFFEAMKMVIDDDRTTSQDLAISVLILEMLTEVSKSYILLAMGATIVHLIHDRTGYEYDKILADMKAGLDAVIGGAE